MTTWTHKVVTFSRGGDGKWFARPAMRTFGSFASAKEYARQIALDRQAVLGETDGHKIAVIPRRKTGERFEFRLCWPRESLASR